jgi:hypothetical protein
MSYIRGWLEEQGLPISRQSLSQLGTPNVAEDRIRVYT